uniref:Glutathione hydrolase 7-like n=1 Tax=Kryptolebias marmoratus TaxID=37003 RepID=A0A3Q3BGQ7_KRYMA
CAAPALRPVDLPPPRGPRTGRSNNTCPAMPSNARILNELTSGSSDLLDQSSSKLKETDEDRCGRDHPVHVYAFSIILAVGVTIALFADPVSIKGVVSDHELCTVLSEKVLRDGGSSVDAAIAGTLCLGVVHPHVSGVGGGGVMLIHKIRQNETRVINFQGSAPNGLREEMLQNASEIKAGLLVGVPGMLMGLHHAHSLYGRFSWENVVSRAAAVAREGFNVSQSLGEQLVGRFRDLFIPNGQPLSPGSYLRMPGVAEVLQAGLFSFYHGNVSQELEDEVIHTNSFFSSTRLEKYIHLLYTIIYNISLLVLEFIIQVPSLPSVGAALIAALNLLESLHLGENNVTENKTYHWINEVLHVHTDTAKSGIFKMYNHTEVLRQKMDFQSSDYNSTVYSPLTELLTSQIVVMGPDDLVVSLNRPFGSRIVTRSGVILNSLVVDFFWPNQSRGQPLTNKPGKRPLSFLMPSMIVPAWSRCGTYMALSSSGGPNRLSEITQMLDSPHGLLVWKYDIMFSR